jgi:hypothetical protein
VTKADHPKSRAKSESSEERWEEMIEDKATEKVKELAKKLGLIVNVGAGKNVKPKTSKKGRKK